MGFTTDKYLSVVQDNRISQTAYVTKKEDDLSLYHRRLINIVISHIKKEDEEFKVETISFKDFMNVMNIPVGGNTEKKIEECINHLIGKTFFIQSNDMLNPIKLTWVEPTNTNVDFEKKMISIQLHKSLEEYFLNLHGNFTSYQIGYTAEFKSKYTYRLYEYLHSYVGQGFIILERNKALKILANNSYTQIGDFKRNVLKNAIDEINEYTDLSVKYKAKRDGKKITHYFFSIKKKSQDDIDIIREDWIDRRSTYEEIANEFSKFINSESDADKETEMNYQTEVL